MRCSKYLYIHQKTYWKHKLYYVPLIYKKSIPNITPHFCLFVLLRLPGVVLTQQEKSCSNRNLWPNHQSLKRKFPWRKWGLKGEKKKWLWRRRDLHVGGRAAAAAWSLRLQVRPGRCHGKLILILARKRKFWFSLVSFMQWHKGRADDWPDRVAKESKTEEPLDKIGSFIFFKPFLINTFYQLTKTLCAVAWFQLYHSTSLEYFFSSALHSIYRFPSTHWPHFIWLAM